MKRTGFTYVLGVLISTNDRHGLAIVKTLFIYFDKLLVMTYILLTYSKILCKHVEM